MGANSSRPADYDAPAYGLFITFIALTTIAITARATSRYLQRASLGMDDALAYMAYASPPRHHSLIKVNLGIAFESCKYNCPTHVSVECCAPQ